MGFPWRPIPSNHSGLDVFCKARTEGWIVFDRPDLWLQPCGKLMGTWRVSDLYVVKTMVKAKTLKASLAGAPI
ncbi:MAG: hypothetical protein B9J98_07940 [Candidatus Terraquivivens tikiterensis]|uniref:Uncharacterized protein n=1 Tax=Candidatus Terraquivivens tikiterensis TaxID=1980982 RepID=A0A2R7Y0T3_9ARCH|nr:MAG: hypothetical protein B9J98_07940 [Candidatus Terraquivivens tikiterensis]